MDKRIAEYSKKKIIDYDRMNVKFEKLFKPNTNIVRRDSYAATPEYAAVYESFYRRSNHLFTLERLRYLVRLRVHVLYPYRPEM